MKLSDIADCSRYNNTELAEYCEVKNKALQCLLDGTGLTLSSSYHEIGDRDNEQDYSVYRNRILYDMKQIGEFVRCVSNTRRINYTAAEILTRFDLYTRKHDYLITHDAFESSIVEFTIMNDNMSNDETIVKLARLKELATQTRQLLILDIL